jgi:hypothetical protein
VVTATSTQDTTKTSSASVTVVVPISITSVAVSPATLSLNTGATNQFAVTVTGTGSYSSSVTWTAQKGTITSAGLYTAPAIACSDVVTATSVQNSSKVANSTLSVLAVAPATPVITAPSQVNAQSSSNTASVPLQANCIYAWTLSGGTISSGQGTPSITFGAGGIGTMQLGCTVTNAASISASAQATISVVSSIPRAMGYYGSGLNSDCLNNVILGASSNVGYNQECSYRLRANHSGVLQSIRPFFIWSFTKAGYQLGTGGTIQIQIQTDDGSTNHHPSGTALATMVYANPVNETVGGFPRLTFPTPPQLSAGQLYHVVFTNIDANPAANWVSLDDSCIFYPYSPMQPTNSDLDLATLARKASTGTWSVMPNNTPIIELDYADGSSQGRGYIDFWAGAPKPISGSAGVRQVFTVSGSDQVVSSASVRVNYLSGHSPLTIRLENANGTLMDQGTVSNFTVSPADSTGSWAKVTFAAPQTLKAGSSYNLVLSAPSDTVFQAIAMQKGTSYGYSSTTVFKDGYAQFNNGTGWTGWDSNGHLNRNDGDLQFFFEVP